MLRTLVLLRHAKAEPPDRYATDRERPLSARGQVDATAAGRWLLDEDLVPDVVACSPAVRTRGTWTRAAAEIGKAIQVVYEPSLYSAGHLETIDLVRQTAATVPTLLVIGHNPTLSIVSTLLDPHGAGGAGLRTAGIAVHRFEGEWRELAPNTAPLVISHTARAH